MTIAASRATGLRDLNHADVVLDHDYVPYKASAGAARRILERADPGFVHLLTRVRDALDPDRRMNPGRW